MLRTNASRLLSRITSPLQTLALAALLAGSIESAAFAAIGDCGLPVNETGPKSSDCLFILQAGVGTRECELCTCDVNDSGDVVASDALLCLRKAVGQTVTLSCPECAVDVTCPGFAEWTTRSGVGGACSNDTQCPLGSCDLDINQCRTATELDFGWKGTAHDADLSDGAMLRLAIDCEASPEGCSDCSIEGIDPSTRSCRCANDTRTVCDAPFESDAGCPACAGGAFAGIACSEDAQCEGGPCEKHCALDPEIVCTTNADCPFGRKLCDEGATCGSGDGASCSTNADCIGTCTGAAGCECYESPPQPVASVGFPFCLVPKLASEVTGSVDVDSGESLLVKDLELLAYGGLSLISPCPSCGGRCANDGEQLCTSNDDCGGSACELDATPNDGVRGGSCVGGAQDGEPCDVMAENASFPARISKPGGGGHSLDCMPEDEELLSGGGLRVRLEETTGTSTLEAQQLCDPGSSSAALCPCLVCSGTLDVACSSNADCTGRQSCAELPGEACSSNGDCAGFDLGTCSAFGNTRCSNSSSTVCATNDDCVNVDFGPCAPSTCSSAGSGIAPRPNACTNESCDEVADDEGRCAIGPDDKACDALLRADGSGIRYCFSNADCSELLLGFHAGSCTLVERRECFVDPVAAEGVVDSNDPVSVATFCVPPTGTIGVNSSLGLPGPARIRRQTELASFCENAPATQYLPGADVCAP